ncbi:hypothetical protein PMAYCL1PPCAC_28734 [Pristionchus mayeri]|uniref:Uncharacterized protein n=1 Tax=Pristionchus mayeri TaxID=1317129 RepID=A0AAN5DAQ7_9BILA|nr:hypothetical protein PMAYCL1PPCAC_28734 [Pristionchus mayeri]
MYLQYIMKLLRLHLLDVFCSFRELLQLRLVPCTLEIRFPECDQIEELLHREKILVCLPKLNKKAVGAVIDVLLPWIVRGFEDHLLETEGARCCGRICTRAREVESSICQLVSRANSSRVFVVAKFRLFERILSVCVEDHIGRFIDHF